MSQTSKTYQIKISITSGGEEAILYFSDSFNFSKLSKIHDGVVKVVGNNSESQKKKELWN